MATEAIDRVCYGRDFGLENPVRVRDDWSNTRRTYTGFKPETFLTHPNIIHRRFHPRGDLPPGSLVNPRGNTSMEKNGTVIP
jgi:hypothetical protein